MSIQIIKIKTACLIVQLYYYVFIPPTHPCAKVCSFAFPPLIGHPLGRDQNENRSWWGRLIVMQTSIRSALNETKQQNNLEAIATLPKCHVEQAAKSRGFTGEEDEEMEVPDVADRRITRKKWPLAPLLTND